ncbi:unnamed protein product, partial [Discosporangium mesarthrocarpum]
GKGLYLSSRGSLVGSLVYDVDSTTHGRGSEWPRRPTQSMWLDWLDAAYGTVTCQSHDTKNHTMHVLLEAVLFLGVATPHLVMPSLARDDGCSRANYENRVAALWATDLVEAILSTSPEAFLTLGQP